jgi:hypothetical protein
LWREEEEERKAERVSKVVNSVEMWKKETTIGVLQFIHPPEKNFITVVDLFFGSSSFFFLATTTTKQNGTRSSQTYTRRFEDLSSSFK